MHPLIAIPKVLRVMEVAILDLARKRALWSIFPSVSVVH